MKISKELVGLVKSKPDLYLKEIVLYDSILPEPKLIRSVSSLLPGMNIVCSPGADAGVDVLGTTGHNAGKTIVCRLIRYCFGEPSYGTRDVESKICATFPNGYIAIVFCLFGQDIAVLRPFRKKRKSSVLVDGTIEQLLEKMPDVTKDEYLKKTGLINLVHQVDGSDLTETELQIRYGQMLSCITPDQDSDLDDILSCRIAKSESGSPSYRFPNLSRLQVCRNLLGLLDMEDLALEQRQKTLEKEGEKINKAMDALRSEPKVREKIGLQELRKLLKRRCPACADIDQLPFASHFMNSDSLTTLANDEVAKVNESLVNLEGKEFELKTALADVVQQLGSAGHISRYNDEKERGKQIKLLAKVGARECPVGKIMPCDCVHVARRNQELNITLNSSVRGQASQGVSVKSQSQLRAEKQSLEISLNETLADIANHRKIILSIRKAKGNIHDLLQDRASEDIDQLLQEHKDRFRGIRSEIADIEKKLRASAVTYEIKRQRLEYIFTCIVQDTLGSDIYGGVVFWDDVNLNFFITQNETNVVCSSMRMLAVLLGSICVQIYNFLSEDSFFSDFLMHDSYRPADLSGAHFSAFIKFIGALQNEFPHGKVPFQYFFTTTTFPPAAYSTDKYVKLWLNSDNDADLLFHRKLEKLIDKQQKLF